MDSKASVEEQELEIQAPPTVESLIGSDHSFENSDDNAKENNKKKLSIQRKFRQEWLEKFTWLQEKENKGYCKCCNRFLQNHLTCLKKLENQIIHTQNYEKLKNQLKIEPYLNKKKNNLKKQIHLAEITLTMFCITHNLPFLLMDYLPNLVVSCCPDSKIAKTLQCGRTKSTQITKMIGNKAKEKIVSDIKTTKFSLIIDESTDVSTKKALILIVRYVDKLSNIIRDRFLSLIELTKSDADSIYETIKQFFSENEIPLTNIIGLATDGASVMAGEINGVQAKLKKDANLLFLKCSCHSLHLCTAYACKKIPIEIEKLCRNIYKFFAFSPKRVNELKEFQEYCSVKPHKILGICLTRWLSLENVINRIIEQWDALKLYFISCYLEVNGINATDLAMQMDKPEIKVYFLFLSYILKIINNLNKEFQSEKVRYLYANMEMTFKLILSNFMSTSFVKNIDSLELTEIDIYNKINYLPTMEIFIGVTADKYLKNSNILESEKIEIKTNIRHYYLELLHQIKLRFDFHLKHLSIITPQKVLSNTDASILPLLTKFSYLVEYDPEIIVTQWKSLSFIDHDLKSHVDINEFWDKVSCIKNGLDEYAFKELTSFVFNLMALPHSSAAAERKFSDLNLIKNKLRNKLEFETINHIMLAKELNQNKNLPHNVWSAKDFF